MKKINFNILDVLFTIIILNLVPVALLGVFKISDDLYRYLYAAIYIVQTILLILSIKNFKSITKKEILFLIVCFSGSMISLLCSLIKYNYFNFNEIVSIISIVINIALFIFYAQHNHITKKELCTFLKKVYILGLISVVINILLNIGNFSSFFTATNSYEIKFSSFFPNRNQYGLFLLTIIIYLSILMTYEFRKKYIFYQLIFIVNLLLSLSRNSMFGLFIFIFIAAVLYVYRKKEIIRKKITKKQILLAAITIITAIIIVILCLKIPYINERINTIFVRPDNITKGSGRFKVWGNAFDIISQGNILFGVSRYNALNVNLTVYANSLSYFHSMYIEKLVTHGLLGLICLIYLLYFVWQKVQKSNIKSTTKIFLSSLLITFWGISFFETTTRFSIGYSDTFFLTFFFTIPTLISGIYNHKK